MYAVIASGGKQYRVSKGDVIRVEKLAGHRWEGLRNRVVGFGKALEDAVDLYHGPFLDGAHLADSPLFDEWVLFTQQQAQRHAGRHQQQQILWASPLPRGHRCACFVMCECFIAILFGSQNATIGQ